MHHPRCGAWRMGGQAQVSIGVPVRKIREQEASFKWVMTENFPYSVEDVNPQSQEYHEF